MGVWTEQGFVAQSIEYYKEAITSVFKEAFGDDFAVDESLPQGVLINRLAELFYGMDMDGVEAFSRLNLNSMSGLFLDTIGNFRGIHRNLGSPQTGLAEVTCNPDIFTPFTLPQGTELVVTETGDTFVTVNQGGDTFDNTTGTIRISFTDNGNSSALINNTMTVEGFSQITNIKIVSLFNGTENESDVSYRNRLIKDYPAATNTIEYILNKIRAIPGVRSVGVLYNDSDTTDPDGVPPYSTEFMYAPIPDADNEDAKSIINAEVAEAIINNKVPGSPTYGTTSVTATDVFGQPKTVNFTVATPVIVHLYVQVGTPETTGILSLEDKDEITETIKEYINGLDISKDISFSRCMAPLTADTGFDVLDFAIRKEEGVVWYDKENVSIGNKEYAVFGSLTMSPNPKPDLE